MRQAKRTPRAESTRAYAGESHEERVRARRERVLEAGLDIIGREGLTAATVRAVCGAAGLNQRYYYESFRDAQDLLVQVYRAQLQRLEESIVGSVEAGLPVGTQVRRAADAYFSTIRADPRLGRVVLFEVLGVSPEVDAVYRAGSQRFEGVVVGIIRGAIPRADASSLDLVVLAQAVVGAMVMVAGNWLLSGFERDQRDIVDSITFVFEAVLEKLSRA